jgi:microcystin-dependent protein
MSEPFLGEIKMVGFNYAPRDWANCYGQSMPITQNQSLFSLLWNNFGGDGRTDFNLPDMSGRTPMHPGGYLRQGNFGGLEDVPLYDSTFPEHTHTVRASNESANNLSPFGGQYQQRNLAVAAKNIYGEPTNLVSLHPNSVTPTVGSNIPHNNVQPSLALRFIIALDGIYPSRS